MIIVSKQPLERNKQHGFRGEKTLISALITLKSSTFISHLFNKSCLSYIPERMNAAMYVNVQHRSMVMFQCSPPYCLYSRWIFMRKKGYHHWPFVCSHAFMKIIRLINFNDPDNWLIQCGFQWRGKGLFFHS